PKAGQVDLAAPARREQRLDLRRRQVAVSDALGQRQPGGRVAVAALVGGEPSLLADLHGKRPPSRDAEAGTAAVAATIAADKQEAVVLARILELAAGEQRREIEPRQIQVPLDVEPVELSAVLARDREEAGERRSRPPLVPADEQRPHLADDRLQSRGLRLHPLLYRGRQVVLLHRPRAPGSVVLHEQPGVGARRGPRERRPLRSCGLATEHVSWVAFHPIPRPP